MSLLTIFLILPIYLSLHIPSHKQSDTYLQTLKQQQSSISSQVSSLKQQVTATLSQVNKQSDISRKIQLLELGILKQKGLLSELSTTAYIKLNESQWECQQYAGTSQNQLNSIIDKITTSTSSIQNIVKNAKNSSSDKFYGPDANSAVNAVSQLQKSVNSQGSIVSNLNSTKQTNWLAPNWSTGSKTLQDVQKQSKQKQHNSGYIETCPFDTPFFDGSNCINCPNNRYFNTQTLKCSECTKFYPSNHSCYSETTPIVTPSTPNQTNLNSGANRVILPNGKSISDYATNQSGNVCPEATPFYSGNTCINCESPNFLFNLTTQKCTTCPVSSTYVQQKHQCVITKQQYVTNLPVSSDRLILPEGTTVTDLQNKQQQTYPNAVLCPTSTPFFNNQSCINCNSNQYFNVGTLQCQNCPTGASYNKTSHKCESVTFYSNLTNRNWTSTNPQSVISQAQNASKNTGAQPCPQNKPFYDDRQCVGCPQGQYFSFDGLKCEECSSGKVFSINQHSCVAPETGVYQTNVTTAPNLIYDGTSKGEWITNYRQNQQKNPQIGDCPGARPYFDGIRCMKCPTEYPYFNLRYQICQVCEQGSKYNESVHQCLSESGDIISQQPNIQKMIASIFT